LVGLSEIYDPGWDAWIDGKKTDVHIADHALRAVAVPAGTHTVELHYTPPYLRLGLAITLGTLAALALTAGAILWRGKRSTGARLWAQVAVPLRHSASSTEKVDR
jgi:uncharacterized membrane protein YfhO